jgi:hypothetical protein
MDATQDNCEMYLTLDESNTVSLKSGTIVTLSILNFYFSPFRP